jgi:hypothetical protein
MAGIKDITIRRTGSTQSIRNALSITRSQSKAKQSAKRSASIIAGASKATRSLKKPKKMTLTTRASLFNPSVPRVSKNIEDRRTRAKRGR